MPMTDTTVSQRMVDLITPMYGHYNQKFTYALDSTTLLPVGLKHEITIPATILPGKQ